MNKDEMLELLRVHPEASELIEYVRGSRGRAGYWRFKPSSEYRPAREGEDTKAQLDARLKIWTAGYRAYGRKGFRKVDEKVLPVMAAEVTEKTKGYKSPYRKTRWDKIMRQMQKALKEIERIVEKRKVEVRA